MSALSTPQGSTTPRPPMKPSRSPPAMDSDPTQPHRAARRPALLPPTPGARGALGFPVHLSACSPQAAPGGTFKVLKPLPTHSALPFPTRGHQGKENPFLHRMQQTPHQKAMLPHGWTQHIPTRHPVQPKAKAQLRAGETQRGDTSSAGKGGEKNKTASGMFCALSAPLLLLG